MAKRKIKSKIYLVPIIIIFIVVGLIYYDNYNNTKDIIKAEYAAKINLIEESIYNETKYTEIISKVVEIDISDKMEENSKILLDKYKQDSNILDWDYKEIQEEVDGMDIYILDENIEVVASSIEEEVGLKVDVYPEFSKLLRQRLKGDKFDTDPINFSILEGELRKYSYMPTPDNKYLLELSVTMKDAYPELKDLNIVYLSKDLKVKYPFVKDIRVFKFNKYRKFAHELDTGNTKLSEEKNKTKDRDKYVKKALETNKSQEQAFENKEGEKCRYRYTPYNVYYDNNELTWWKSYVIEVLYNDEIIRDKLKQEKMRFTWSMTIITILYFGFSFTIIDLMQKK